MSEKWNRNDPCWCGSGKKYKKCHSEMEEKILEYERQGHIVPSRDIIKTPEEIAGIKESGLLNIAILDHVARQIREGMSTMEIDRLVADKTKELGAIAAPLNYEGFPNSTCTSFNDQVCHGIPSENDILKSGDIVNVDVSTIYNGFYSDSSRMFLIGDVAEDRKKLVAVTRECLDLGLTQVKPWGFLGDIGQVINDHAKANGYTVVREIGGHGVGLDFHEEPWVSHVSEKGTEMLMVPGMVFTIEPMVNMGKEDVYLDSENNWTIYTKDHQPSAQWEYTVLVTEDGYEVLAY